MEEDKKLYSEFLNGNKNAFNMLVSKYRKNVIYFITRFVKSIDEAEDIFQDVVLYLLENAKIYNPKYSFKSYLYTIARSKALNYLNKNKLPNTNLEELENTPEQNGLLEEIILSNERKTKIQKVISSLKPEYQLVIYLTQIEGLTYKETARIIEKTEKQIKNSTYNAKKTLKKLLIKERVIEMKHNKFIRLLSWILVIAIITSGVVVATKIIKDKINNVKLSAGFSGSIGNIKGNKVWVGTFDIAWNEFINYLGTPIEFENGISELADNLNNQSFSKDMLNENSYYIGQGPVSPDLKSEIEKNLKEKFGTSSDVLDDINWKSSDNEYLIYAMLNKSFTFKTPFRELSKAPFSNSEINVKYFGLDCPTVEDTFEQVTALFYNSDSDFAVKIDTIEGEEVILYRINNINNFQDTYNEVEKKASEYSGKKYLLREKDELRIPFISVNATINYDELCHKPIKNTNGVYLLSAVQNVNFSLTNLGGNLSSEAYVDFYLSEALEEPRYFNFTDTFVLYLKEKDKDKPYFALFVDNIDILVEK